MCNQKNVGQNLTRFTKTYDVSTETLGLDYVIKQNWGAPKDNKVSIIGYRNHLEIPGNRRPETNRNEE